MRFIGETVLLPAAALFSLASVAQADYWDTRFFLDGINGTVNATVASGSAVYVAGEFISADRAALTNVAKWDGARWSALGGGVNGEVNAIAVRGSDVFVGGLFTHASGVPANRIARWDGTTWSGLGGGIMGNRVNALAVDQTSLYAAGEFTNAAGVAVANIARWDGTNWAALGSGLRNDPYQAWVLALALRGAELFAGGFFTDAGGVSVSCIAKWNGQSWMSLGAGVDDLDYLPQVTSLAISGNDLYVGGAFAKAGSVSAANVARWDGAGWSRLGDGLGRYFGEIPVRALTASGTRLTVGGRFISANGIPANNLAVWNGATWAELGGGASGDVHALGLNGTNLLVGGNFSVAGHSRPLGFAQWNGLAWSNVSTGGGQGIYGSRSCAQTCAGDSIAALAVAGTITYAAGAFSSAGDSSAQNIAAWNGFTWSPLGNGLNGLVNALAMRQGHLLAGGNFTMAGGVPVTNIARWNGINWSGLGGGVNGPVNALLVSGNVAYVGGAFSSAGGIPASNIARWDGTNWAGLGGGLNGPVHALAILGDNIFVGGRFTSAGGVIATNIARWHGMAWSPLGNGVTGNANPVARFRPPPVSALAVHGNNLFVGGDFAFAGGSPATNIARWDTTNWWSLGTGLPGPSGIAPPPAVAALLSDGAHLWTGGSFVRADGAPANGLARWDGTDWNVSGDGVTGGISAPALVSALARNIEGICVGGHFKFAGSKPAAGFSQILSAPSLRISRGNGMVQISWPRAATGFLLQQSESLAPPFWHAVTNAAISADGERTIIPSNPTGALFFRLLGH